MSNKIVKKYFEIMSDDEILKQLNIKNHDFIKIKVKKGKLIITKATETEISNASVEMGIKWNSNYFSDRSLR